MAAVALHLGLLLVRLVGTDPEAMRRGPSLVTLVPLADTAVVRLMPYVPTPSPVRRVPGEPRPRPRVLPEERTPVNFPSVDPPELAEPVARPEPPPEIATEQPSSGRGLRPSLGDGKLWSRPMPLPPRELASRLRGKTHGELVDSAVTAIVQQYLDSLANDPTVRKAAVPSWVGTIGGKEFGTDGRNLIIAGLRIPAAVLAFLPISLPTRFDPNRDAPRVRDMRDDLYRAAARAENYAEWKRGIREIRERKQAERDFEQNQRTAPEQAADSAAGTP
jgi:hypothetical protein